MRGGRGTVNAAARPTTATASGNSSGFATCGSGSKPDQPLRSERVGDVEQVRDAAGGQECGHRDEHEQRAGERHPGDGVPPRRGRAGHDRPGHGGRGCEKSDRSGALVEDREGRREREHRGGARADQLPQVVVRADDGPRQQDECGDREHADAVTLDPQTPQRGVLERLRQGRPAQGDEREPRAGRRRPRQHHCAERAAADREPREQEHRDRRHHLVMTVRTDPEHRDAEAEGGGHLRCEQPPGREAQTERDRQERGADDDEEPLVARRPQPPGVLGAEHVQHDEAQRHGGERLGSDPEVAAGQPLAREDGRDGQPDQHGGAAADVEPRPRHGQEDHGGDEHAGGAEPEQDLGHRGGAEAGGGWGAAGERGRGYGAAYERTGAEAGLRAARAGRERSHNGGSSR